jgi:hypothetical protein
MDPLQIRLARLRRYLRVVITFRGACLLLSIFLGAAVLAGWIDWRLPGHLPSLVRALILVATLSAAGVVGYWFLLGPWFRRADNLSLALQIEDLYPSLSDSLGSTVEFLGMPEESEGAGSRGLRLAAVQQTLKKVHDLNFFRVVDTRGVRTAGLSLILCGGAAVALVLLNPLLAWTALERLANPFGQCDWPRQTLIELDIKPHSRIARGDSFDIRGRVRGVIPEQATIAFEGISPPKQAYNLLHDADPNVGILSARVERVDHAFRFQVEANDSVSEWYEVEVLPPPVLVPLDGRPSPQVTLHYPAYTDLPDLDLPDGSGNIEAVAGTRVSLRAAADRRLTNAWIEYRPDQALVKPAAFLAPLGASHLAGSLALLAGGQEVWGLVPVQLDPYGRKMTVEFLPYVSGLYALHFQDEEGIANTRLFDLHIYPDPAPVVTLERPSKSRDSLDLLPHGQFALQATVEDRQFAIRSVFLEYRCQKDDPPRRLPLYDDREFEAALPQLMGSLAGMPLPVAGSTLRLRPQRLEISRRLALTQFRHLDDVLLKAGDILTIRVCAEDFDNVAIDKQPGRSHEVELRIITQSALEANLNREQKQLQEELLRLRKWQQEALQDVIGAEQRWRNTGRLERRDLDRLIQAEQLQQQIRDRVGSKQEGLQADVERILETLRDNQQPPSSTQERMDTVARELDRLAREELSQIEPRLTGARKENETTSKDVKPPDSGRNGLLGEARQHQEEVESTLSNLLKLLEPWGHINQVKGEAKAILQEQQHLNQQTKALDRKENLGVSRQALTPEQRAELDEASKLQERLEERTDQLLGRMERTAQEKESAAEKKQQQALDNVKAARKLESDFKLRKALENAEEAINEANRAIQEAGQGAGKEKEEKRQQAKDQRQLAQEQLRKASERQPRDPSAAKAIAEATEAMAEASDLAEVAEPLQEASQIGREGNLKEAMKQARENIGKNQAAKANEAQQNAVKNLEEVIKALDERREKELERLQKKLKEAEKKLAEMAKEQERLRKKTKEVQQIADAQEHERQLKELARQQEELRKKTQALLKELNRYRAERARQALSGASGNMEQAGQQLNRGQDPDEPQEEALDRLNDARRALQQERKEIEEELAREKLAKISDQIKRLKERQEAAIAEAERIQKLVLQEKAWGRSRQASFGNLASVQESLGKETRNLAEEKLKGAPVFARLMGKSAGSMEQAAERIKDQLATLADRPDQLTLDEPARKLQGSALHRLEQLLDALKEEKGMARGGGQGGGGGQPSGGGQPRGDGIPPLAELKVLRSLQKEINDLTENFGKQHPNFDKFTDPEKRELEGLSKEQKELADLLDEVTKPPEAGGSAEEQGSKIEAREKRKSGDRGSDFQVNVFDSPSFSVYPSSKFLFADDNSGQDQPEPPLRLKKKANAKSEAKPEEKQLKSKLKDKAEKETGEPDLAEPEKDPQEIMARIAKNMKESQDRLSKKDPSDGTRQVQRDIIKDIDSLINQKSRQQQQQQQQAQQNSQSSSSRRQANSQRQKATRPQQAAGKQSQPRPQPQQAAAKNPGGGGNRNKDAMGRDADLFKDIWGHLPETLRKDMDAYSRVEFMMKYGDLLKQYYSTIAEKGRRKGE